MRSVDTRALGRVAGTLGIGNPATAVEDVIFDDDNLQQSLPVDRLLPGVGVMDGWAWLSNTINLIGATTGAGFVTQQQILDVVNPAPTAQQLRIWLMHVGGFGSAATLTAQLVSIETGAFPGNPSGGLRQMVFFGDSQTPFTDETTGGSFLTFQEGGNGVLPLPLLHDARINHRASSSDDLLISAGLLFWVGPLGLSPPGVA